MVHNDVSFPDPDASPIRVLVAWRPDSRGTEAIEFAAWLARTTDIRVRAVTTFLRPWPSTSLSKLGGKYRKWYEKEAAACEQKVRRAFANAGIDKHSWDEQVSVFVDGPSESVLLTEAADNFDAHLVVLGSGAAAPKGRFRAGSVADALLHSSPKPLGLAPRSVKLSKRGITRVNFAFLDSRATEHDASLHFAARIAARWDVPLRILAFSPTGIGDAPQYDRGNLTSELTDEWREHSLGMLDRASDAVHDQLPELTIETEIGTGVGWSGAIDALKWKKGDMLCLGSTPLGPIESVFLGSTATEFLRYVSVPVLIHPAPHV